MKNKIAPAIALMTEYLEEGYDAELIGRLDRRELAGLIVCPANLTLTQGQIDGYTWTQFHFDQIIYLAKEALLALVLEDIARND